MKICYVLAYREPDYIRTRTLCQAIGAIDGVRIFPAVNTDRGLLRYAQTILSVLRVKRTHRPDCYIIGFRGHDIYWPIRWIVGKRPILLDALMSPSAALKEERKYGALGRMAGIPCRWIERSILKNADQALTDTHLHRIFYETEFHLPEGKILPVPVGAVETDDLSPPVSNLPDRGFFRILFYGSFLPLHGVEVILRAAAKIGELPVRFEFIGGNDRQAAAFHRLCAALNLHNCNHRKWIDFNRLIHEEIPMADLCLGGPFGNTPQARRVVTGKTSQCLALGKATVIGHIEEDYGFADKKNCLLVPQGDDGALADAMRWAYSHRGQLKAMGELGRRIYHDRLSVEVVREKLSAHLTRLTQGT